MNHLVFAEAKNFVDIKTACTDVQPFFQLSGATLKWLESCPEPEQMMKVTLVIHIQEGQQ